MNRWGLSAGQSWAGRGRVVGQSRAGRGQVAGRWISMEKPNSKVSKYSYGDADDIHAVSHPRRPALARPVRPRRLAPPALVGPHLPLWSSKNPLLPRTADCRLPPLRLLLGALGLGDSPPLHLPLPLLWPLQSPGASRRQCSSRHARSKHRRCPILAGCRRLCPRARMVRLQDLPLRLQARRSPRPPLVRPTHRL